MGCPRLVRAVLAPVNTRAISPGPPKLFELSLEVEHGLLLQATGARLPMEDSTNRSVLR
jgi:hypothetical protein